MSVNTFLPPSPVIPMFLTITSVTNSKPMMVTTNTPNSWVAGQVAYFSVPDDYGMYQLNTLNLKVLAVNPSNTILTFQTDSTQFDPFVIPSSGVEPATMSPCGSRNLYNFSEVPFHSQGNFGN